MNIMFIVKVKILWVHKWTYRTSPPFPCPLPPPQYYGDCYLYNGEKNLNTWTCSTRRNVFFIINRLDLATGM